MGTGAGANRYGWRTSGVPQVVQGGNNLSLTPAADLPLDRWGILTWRLGNSTGDFIKFGAAANTATGINCGNTDPTAIGKFAINSGAQGIVGSEGLEFRWGADLTATEDEDVEDLISAYYGDLILKYDSTGNIKPVLYSFFGDSQTRGDVSYNYEGFRFDFFTEYFTNLGYSTYATGTSSQGTWDQPANSGVSALGINIDAGGPNPAAAQEFIELHYGSAAAAPVNGAGSVQLMLVMIGGADIAGGTYVPVTTAADYVTLIQRILDLEPQCRVVVTTICPQQGDPADIPAFNAELSDPGGAWDVLDTANPGREVIRYDAFTALGGAYNAALYIDNVHLNQAGQQLVGAALVAAVATIMNTKTTY